MNSSHVRYWIIFNMRSGKKISPCKYNFFAQVIKINKVLFMHLVSKAQ